MPTILDNIVAAKREEVARAKSERRKRRCAAGWPMPRRRATFSPRCPAGPPIRLIAEVKKASPSKGVIRADFDPVAIARTYQQHGASCISVLTDEPYFQGSLEHLRQVRAAVDLPVLRKDFIIDPYQVVEARAAGADAVLLIAECLDDESLARLHDAIVELGMTPLVELYEPANLPRVLQIGARLVGVNNRDLHTFEVDLEHTLRLRRQIPADRVLVGESGIRTRQDVQRLEAAGVQAMLVGESLLARARRGRRGRRTAGNEPMSELQTGELLALATAMLWTLSSLAWTSAGKRIGALAVSFIRLVIAAAFMVAYCRIVRHLWLPTDADARTWLLMGASGFFGFFLCDICLFKSMLLIGPRLTLLLFSLSPPIAAIISWVFINDELALRQWIAMAVTLAGIVWVVMERPNGRAVSHSARPSLARHPPRRVGIADQRDWTGAVEGGDRPLRRNGGHVDPGHRRAARLHRADHALAALARHAGRRARPAGRRTS